MGAADVVGSTGGETEGLQDGHTVITLPLPSVGSALLPPASCVTLRNSLLPSGLLTGMQA